MRIRRRRAVAGLPVDAPLDPQVVGVCGSCGGPLIRMAGVVRGATCPCGDSALTERLLDPHNVRGLAKTTLPG